MSFNICASDTITVGLGPKYNPEIGPYVSAKYLNIRGICNPFRFRNSFGSCGILPKIGTCQISNILYPVRTKNDLISQPNN